MIELISFCWDTSSALIREDGAYWRLSPPYTARVKEPSPPGRKPTPLATFGFAGTLEENLKLRHTIQLAGFMGASLQWLKKKTNCNSDILFRELLREWGAVWVPTKQSEKVLRLLSALRFLEAYSNKSMSPFVERVEALFPSCVPASLAILSIPPGRVDLEHDPIFSFLENRAEIENIAQLGMNALFYLRLRGYADASQAGEKLDDLYQELRRQRNRLRAIETNKIRRPWQKNAGNVKQYIKGNAKS